MLKPALVVSALLILQTCVIAQDQANRNQVPVEVVATASEYVPHSTTVSHPGHTYTDCHGSTSYWGDFTFRGSDYSGSISGRGDISGTGETDTHCKSSFSPPAHTTLTTYRKVSYTVAKSGQTLYLLACTAHWIPSAGTRFRALVAAGSKEAEETHTQQERAQEVYATGSGRWSDCPAFSIGDRYTLRIHSASDARLEDSAGGKPTKLEYVKSVPLAASTVQAPSQAASTAGEAKVHITSSPSGGEIYVDGKFFGNTPSDITLPTGEHAVKITAGSKEWSRTVQITTGEIHLHAEIAEK